MEPDDIRLLIDECVHQKLGGMLRAEGFDAKHIAELGRKSTDDLGVLELAVSQRRAVVTFNVADFVRLHWQWQDEGREHYGLLFREIERDVKVFRRMLLDTIARHPPDEVYNCFQPIYLD